MKFLSHSLIKRNFVKKIFLVILSSLQVPLDLNEKFPKLFLYTKSSFNLQPWLFVWEYFPRNTNVWWWFLGNHRLCLFDDDKWISLESLLTSITMCSCLLLFNSHSLPTNLISFYNTLHISFDCIHAIFVPESI